MGAITEGAAKWVKHTGKYIGGLLEGNKAITKAYPQKYGMTANALSPFEAISRYAYGGKGYGFTDALADTFLMEKDVAAANVVDNAGKIIREAGTRDWGPSNWAKGKIAGSVVGIGVTAGIAGGLTHDTAGNIDIAGIPGI